MGSGESVMLIHITSCPTAIFGKSKGRGSARVLFATIMGQHYHVDKHGAILFGYA
jgi:hypothetical protein